jgi:small subunit ribosomal protein S17
MARQTFTGLVISQGKMNKTIKVRVQKKKFNRVVHKEILEYRDFMVHDELNKCQEGDIVRIQYVRPLSARKSFAVAEVMKYKGTEWMKYQAEAPDKVAREELEKIEEYKKEREIRMAAQGGSSIVEDLRKVEKIFYGDKSVESEKASIQKLMNKYGITAWPPSHEVVQLDVARLRNELKELNITINASSFSSYVKELLTNDPQKADEILSSLGEGDVTNMKPNIKRNILMKHFAKSLNSIPSK